MNSDRSWFWNRGYLDGLKGARPSAPDETATKLAQKIGRPANERRMTEHWPITARAGTAFGVGLMLVALAGCAVLGGSERDRICARGFPESNRPDRQTWEKLSRAVLMRAGIPWEMRHTVEIDHICPNGLGCPSSLDNLQAQPCYRWSVDARGHHCVEGPAAEKDILERRARADYCAGRILLDVAKAQFRREWP